MEEKSVSAWQEALWLYMMQISLFENVDSFLDNR